MILEASPCLVVGLAEQSIDFRFLRSTGLRCPAETSVVAQPGLAHNERRQSGPDGKVARLTGSAGAGADVVGTKDDLFCRTPGQNRPESLQHGAAGEHLRVARDGGDEAQCAVQPRNDGGEDEMPALVGAQ